MPKNKRYLIYLVSSILILIIINFLLSTLNFKGKDQNKELIIFAASSLQNVMPDLEKEFIKIYPSVNLFFNFASSGQLRAQILNGAKVDIFIPVSVTNKTDRILAKNRLVLITDKNNRSITSILDLTKPWVQKIAIGDPMTVPAGIAAIECFNHFKILSQIKHKLVLTTNVRQALYYVSKNEVDAGMVFLTDSHTDQNVKIVHNIKYNLCTPIIYPIYIMNNSQNIKLSNKFLGFLNSKIAKRKLKEHFFIIN